MKTSSLINVSLFALMPLVFITCKKSDDSPKACKVVKIAIASVGNDTAFIKYSYDATDRLIKTDLEEGNYTTYNFEPNKVTSKTYVGNALSYTEIFTLNAEGMAVSSTYALAGAAVSKTIAYEYDSDGFLISKATTLVGHSSVDDTYTYEYENGNLIDEAHDYTADGLPSTDKTYQYYTDKSNNFDLKVSIMGKKSANLLKKTVFTIYSNSTITSKPVISSVKKAALNSDVVITTSYTYEFLTDGKVAKQTTTIGTGSLVNIPYYECN